MTTLINIIGYGYVGSALGHVCAVNGVPFCTYDIIKREDPMSLGNFDKLNELVMYSESKNERNVYFICVPTPNRESGECDTSTISSILSDLSKMCTRRTYVIIKSTVEPGTCRRFSNEFGTELLSIAYCPEFLREKTFREDMYDAKFALLGFNKLEESPFEADIMRWIYNHNKSIEVIDRTYEQCELFKYTINVYLSVKVWFFNEVDSLCNKLNVDYSDLQSLFRLDDRIGESHTDVPGHDGKRGFGGKCLPKETRAMRYLQQTLGIDDTILSKILERNTLFRGE